MIDADKMPVRPGFPDYRRRELDEFDEVIDRARISHEASAAERVSVDEDGDPAFD